MYKICKNVANIGKVLPKLQLCVYVLLGKQETAADMIQKFLRYDREISSNRFFATAATKMEVIVFGSAIMDLVGYVERLPKPGETLHGHKFQIGFGGKGANQCVQAARMGANTALIAKLGDDDNGRNYLNQLRKENVNVDFVKQVPKETTGIALINVSDKGENHIVIVTAANKHLSAEDVCNAGPLFNTAKVLVCQLEVPVAATLAALQEFRGISILNAAPAMKDTPCEMLKAATILCVNESEAALMTGSSEIKTLEQSKAAVQKLIKMGANTVILTLGELGAIYIESGGAGECFHVPSPKVEKVVDTTGAGDSFIGALAYIIARYPDKAMHQQIGAACTIAAHSVQLPGTQSSYPTICEIESKLIGKTFDCKKI